MGRSSSQLHATSSLPPLKQIARGSAHLAVSFVVTRARCRCTNGTRVSASVLSHCSCSVIGLKNGRTQIWSSPIAIFLCDLHATFLLPQLWWTLLLMPHCCVLPSWWRSTDSKVEVLQIAYLVLPVSLCACEFVRQNGNYGYHKAIKYEPVFIPAFHLSNQVARCILHSLTHRVSRTCVLLRSGRQDESTLRSCVRNSRPVPATTLSAVPSFAFTSVLLPAPVSPNSITRRCSVFRSLFLC